MTSNRESPPPHHQRQTIALLLIVTLLFVALIGGFLTGHWEAFQLLCPFGLGALAGQLPQHVPPPSTQEPR